MLQKILNNKHQALLVLPVTAMPGIQRAFVVLLVQFTFGLQSLGQFTNDLSIVFLMTHFTAIGWASLILVRVPSAKGVERLLVIRRMFRFIFPVLGVAVLLIVGLGLSGVVFQPLFMLGLLAGWTGYQLIRHFFVALREYRTLLTIDLLSTGCMVVLLLLPGNRVDPLLAIGIPLMGITMAGFLYLMFELRHVEETAVRDSKDLKLGIELGTTNFLGEGMILLLAPLANLLAGPSYAGLIGLVLSGVGIILLFPRAFAMYQVPELARADKKEAPLQFLVMYRSFRQVLLKLLLIMGTALLLMATIGGPFLFPEAISLENAWTIFGLVLLSTIIGQMGLPDSSRLMVKEQSHLMMRINAVAFGAFTTVAGILYFMPWSVFNLVFLLVAQVAVNGMRSLLLNVYARRMHYGCLVESTT